MPREEEGRGKGETYMSGLACCQAAEAGNPAAPPAIARGAANSITRGWSMRHLLVHAKGPNASRLGRASHIGDEEIFCSRGVGADGAERVREGYHVGGRLWARAAGRCGVE
jgi:hypothetical protein